MRAVVDTNLYYDDESRVRFVALVAALGEIVEMPTQVPRICRAPADDWVIIWNRQPSSIASA